MATSINSPFWYAGSKQKLATPIVNEIRKHFPNETHLLSPFLGAASVELRFQHALRGTCSGADIEEPLINCWVWLQREPRKVVRRCEELMPMCREKWAEFYAEWALPQFPCTLENAARYILLRATRLRQANAFSPMFCDNFNKPTNHRSAFSRLMRFRAPRMEVHCIDFELFLHSMGPGLAYCDPPYVEAEHVYARHGQTDDMCFTMADHERLADCLLERGQFVLSYGAHPWVRERYAQPGVEIQELRTQYENRRLRGKDPNVVELLIIQH